MKLKSVFKKIESIPTTLKLVIGTIVVASLTHTTLTVTKTNDVTESSVMIVRPDRKSGGTGVIISSSNTETKILTNSHVCKAIENGGLVISKGRESRIASYLHSQNHDLCLVKVRANLGVNTKIADRSPRRFYEKGFISGHPRLLPNVVTSGHFSGNMIIQVLAGFEKCSEEDVKNPNLIMFCLFLGGIPVIKEYESTLVTATIMPGSSGSGVYNEDMELSGLAFAGSGELGYAWTVPYEDMKNFLDVEVGNSFDTKTPDAIDVKGLLKRSSNEEHISFENAKKACQDATLAVKLKDFCEIFNRDILWRW